MRVDNSLFTVANKKNWREPRIVVEVAFDEANTDLYYVTSHSVTGLSGANVIENCVKGVSGTSQKINPDKALSTIGSMSFQALDLGLTDLQKTKLNSNFGLKGKRVRFYIGDESLSWSDYILAQTQIVESVDYKDSVYTFKCSDVQRQMRKDIFELKKTSISASLTAGSETISVFNTSEFEMVRQPASPTGVTDAPGQKVGYLKLSNDCIVRYTGKTATEFTGCTWGVFDTGHLIEDIDKQADSGADNAPAVTEYVYLEMPAVMLAYALLTGSLYNDPGEYLPAHWHLGIDTQYIRTSDFINIGADWWELGDNDAGVPAVIRDIKKTDGKKFIEEQLYLMLGAFSPVYANGELGLKRMTVIPSQGGYVRELNERNIIGYGTLKHDMKSVINMAVLSWNYVPLKGEYTRKNVMPDALSIARHGQSDTLELKFKSLATSRHSYATIKSRFDSLRDRYAGPPLRLSLTLMPSQNDLEVGDIVRVNLDQIKDYTGVTTDEALRRNFEVQKVATDWVTGKVSVDLFGSSQNASALPAAEPGTALANSWYSIAGTEINATNFPGAVSESGGVTHITGNINLTGNASLLASSDALYYCNQDLTIDAGAVVTINDNVQIRVKGFFQNNGIIDGKGRGLPGGVGTADNGHVSNNGLASFLGATESQDGVLNHKDYYALKIGEFETVSYYGAFATAKNRQPAIIGLNQSAPNLNLQTSEISLFGVPDDIRGASGSAGGAIHNLDPGFVSEHNNIPGSESWVKGGDGGNGGAGLLIVCRGMDYGAAGKIDLSGNDGSEGIAHIGFGSSNARTIRSGAGAGGYCGALYIILDGPTSTAPTMNNANTVLEAGRCPVAADELNLINDTLLWHIEFDDRNVNTFGSAYVGAQPARVNTFESNARIQYLTGYIPAQPDTPDYADVPLAITLSEATNTPRSAAGNLSSIEVTMTPPADPSYSHAMVYYRVQGGAGWTAVGAASPEITITVPSDGKTYEVGAQAVSKSGNESNGGISDLITVTDVINLPPDSVLDTVMPLVGINAISLKDYAGTVFAGRDAKFEWDNLNAELEHFLHYKVEIVDTGANTVRSETVTDPSFVYTYEKNSEDYKNQVGSIGANRQFTIRVTPVARTRNDQGNLYEGATASLTVSNDAPALPTNLTVSPGFKIAKISFDVPTDIDYKEMRVWGSTTTGFTVNDSSLVAVTKSGPITVTGLDDDTTYYYRIATFDEFGQGTLSAEHTITTQEILVPAFGPWATVTTADVAFIGQHLASNSISGDKIIKLTASKIVTGTLAATAAISCEGIIEAFAGTYNVTIGPKDLGGAQAALFSYTNNGSPIVAFYEDGTAEFSGEVKASVVTGSTINGSTINGTLFRTATAGKRVEISSISNRFHVYDSSNVARVTIDDANGSVGYLEVNGGPNDYAYVAAGNQYGFRAANTNQYGAFLQGSSYGVRGDSAGGQGVYGSSTNNYGGYFTSTNSHALYAYVSHAGSAVWGVNGNNGNGVNGKSVSGNGGFFECTNGSGIYSTSSGGVGVFGISSTNYGGRFQSSTTIAAYGSGVHGFWGVGSSNGYGLYGSGKYGAYLTGTTYDAYLYHNTVGSFTGGHDALLLKGTNNYQLGDIFVVDSIIERSSISNAIPAVSLANSELSKASYGVLSNVMTMPDVMIEVDPETEVETSRIPIAALSNKTVSEYEALQSTYDSVIVNGVGEGQINVCSEGGDFEVGDFISTSNTPGKGKLYTGNDMRYVVAKIMEPVIWANETGTEKTVACVYMCS